MYKEQNKIQEGFTNYLKIIGYGKTSIFNLPKIINEFLNFIHQNIAQETMDYRPWTIDSITETNIKTYINYIETRPHKRNKNGALSVSYIKQHIYAIKLFFNYLEEIEIIKTNPSTNIIYDKKIENKQREILNQEEVQVLFNNTETPIETAVLHLAYSCGMRKSEIENLEIKDIDFKENRIYIRAEKNKKRRVIPITEKVKNDLKQYLLNERKITKTNYFLVNRTGTQMQGNSLYNIVKPLINKAGLNKNICLHSLRHSIATHLLENGMKVEYVRDFLGHNQLKTTQIYTRVNQCNNLKM